jgi:ABC-2 type transport system permease protein
MTVVSLGMAYRSFLEVLAGSHPPRYAASLKPSSPRFTHSSHATAGTVNVISLRTVPEEQPSAGLFLATPTCYPLPREGPPNDQLGQTCMTFELSAVKRQERNVPPVRTFTADQLADEAIADLVNGLLAHEMWGALAFHEIRQRFRRSLLGPLWLTLSMGIMVAAIGLVFSTLFQQDMRQTLPHIAVGLIFWGLLTSCINEGTTAFINNEAFIKNVPLPLSVHFYQMMARNLIILAFNMIIYLIVLIAFRITIDWQFLLFIPSFFLFLLNAAWMGLAAGILSTRYRDIPQVISNILGVIFFVTPIFWSAETLPRRPAFVDWNPFYHLLELARSPLLGQGISTQSWTFSFVLAVVGIVVTRYLYRRAYARIPYWV